MPQRRRVLAQEVKWPFSRRREVPPEWVDAITEGDARVLCRGLPTASVDLIFTDPVYSQVQDYEWLARMARRVLKPGGYCYAYSGNINVLDCAWAMRRHLTYGGMFALVGTGGYINRWRFIGAWKPILVFTKGKGAKTPYQLNMFNAAPDKRYHRWGQGASPAFNTVKICTKPGDLVLDPFCGGGTVAAVCQALGRRFVTFEIDPEAAAVARARLAWRDLPMFAKEEPGTLARAHEME